MLDVLMAKRIRNQTAGNTKGNQAEAGQGVSVIVCTNRPRLLQNVFENYRRQLYKPKELIIVLNNNGMNLNRYKEAAKKHVNVSVYRRDESVSLGRCLNFAVTKAKYPIIAKFDDDDYYSSHYLNGVMRCFYAGKADVLGKNTCYMYLQRRNLLLLFHPNKDNRFTDMVMGSTVAFRRKVFRKVKFRNVSRGEDTFFFTDCERHKIRIYSCDRFNYVCIRRSSRYSHTWSIDEKTLIEHSKTVARTRNFKPYITRVVNVSSSDKQNR